MRPPLARAWLPATSPMRWLRSLSPSICRLHASTLPEGSLAGDGCKTVEVTVPDRGFVPAGLRPTRWAAWPDRHRGRAWKVERAATWVALAIWRWERPASYLSRTISRILRMDNLAWATASSPLDKRGGHSGVIPPDWTDIRRSRTGMRRNLQVDDHYPIYFSSRRNNFSDNFNYMRVTQSLRE